MTPSPARLILAGMLCAISAVALGQVVEPGKAPGYVGAETCISCHSGVGEAWTSSHHARAWNEPTEHSVLGDFNDRTFEHGGGVNQLSKGDGKFFVTTDGADGRLQKFEVVGTVGVAPLQQYLVETEPGRLQALDLAWDTVRKRWYHLYPDQDLSHTDGLHWTGPYKNWNARCAECHATGYEKRYVPLTRRYSSTQAETGVGCEACHGPGAAHVAWARDRKSFDQTIWRGVNTLGLTIGFDRKSAETEIQQCAGCHSRREAFSDTSPVPGTPFHDSYRLALLREGLYHVDGQIRGEVYVYGSFLQSKMYERGVRCTNCHNPHSGALKAKGNAVCTQCHNPAGNPDFPTLKKANYSSQKHHFHPPGTASAECKSCHMIERVYMGIDGRRDHSFRVPRPDLSVKLDTPNACTDCHRGKGAKWAADKVRQWYPDGRSGTPHFAEVFDVARGGGAADKRQNLLGIATDKRQSAVVRATALILLAPVIDPQTAKTLALLLEAEDPVIRAAAVRAHRDLPPPIKVPRILPLLSDPMRAVRIEVAKALLGIPPSRFAGEVRAAIGKVMREYQASLLAKADFPESQMAIAGTALTMRNFRVAESAFSQAAEMDPQLVDAWAMIARLRAARSDVEGATKVLLDGLAANPNDVNLTRILKNFLSSDRQN